jgi:hypothetical protein
MVFRQATPAFASPSCLNGAGTIGVYRVFRGNVRKTYS